MKQIFYSLTPHATSRVFCTYIQNLSFSFSRCNTTVDHSQDDSTLHFCSLPRNTPSYLPFTICHAHIERGLFSPPATPLFIQQSLVLSSLLQAIIQDHSLLTIYTNFCCYYYYVPYHTIPYHIEYCNCKTLLNAISYYSP
jgi:hypothetical protein